MLTFKHIPFLLKWGWNTLGSLVVIVILFFPVFLFSMFEVHYLNCLQRFFSLHAPRVNTQFPQQNLHHRSHGIKDWYMLHLPSQQKPKGAPQCHPSLKGLLTIRFRVPHAPAGPLFVPCCAVQAAGRKENQFFLGGEGSRKDEGSCFLYSIVITGIKILYIFVCECVV